MEDGERAHPHTQHAHQTAQPHPHTHQQTAQNRSHHTHTHGGLTLSLPSSSPKLVPEGVVALPANANGNGNGRDDCWSEGATNTLIESWGDRYLELNRGNLKQKHWKDVADAVNSRENGTKVHKTDVQCKNRLDTLKKKYKLEKSKICNGAGFVSKWPFYHKLDELIGPSRKHQLKHPPQHPKPMPLPLPLSQPFPAKPLKEKRPAEEAAAAEVNPGFNSRSSKSKETPDTTESYPNVVLDGRNCKKGKLCESPFKDLARAILKFGEVYEKIETSKQRQIMVLEKQRMEFIKDLEVERMQLFVQTQVELAKMKHGKHGNTEHYL